MPFVSTDSGGVFEGRLAGSGVALRADNSPNAAASTRMTAAIMPINR